MALKVYRRILKLMLNLTVTREAAGGWDFVMLDGYCS